MPGDERCLGRRRRRETHEAPTRAVEETDEQASADVMALLGEHVPLALLADLAEPTGPQSPTILEDEGLPEVAWWEPSDEKAEPDE